MNYDRNTTIWGSYGGRAQYIKDLSDSYVVNILNWMQDNPEHYKDKLYKVFEEEAAIRRLWAFAEDKPMPVKLPNGRYGFENITWFQRLKHNAKLLKHNTLIYLQSKRNLLKKKRFKVKKRP